MATRTIVGAKRVSIVRSDGSVYTLNEKLLGEEPLSLTIAPRMMDDSSSKGTAHQPIAGTIDDFQATLTVKFRNYRVLGEILGMWNDATYAGATAEAGNLTNGGTDVCGTGETVRVVLQGICDDGSTDDIDLPRCLPSFSDDLTLSTTEIQDYAISLNPQFYDAVEHAADGLPAYDYRLGDYSLTTKYRFNVTTGEYEEVVGSV